MAIHDYREQAKEFPENEKIGFRGEKHVSIQAVEGINGLYGFKTWLKRVGAAGFSPLIKVKKWTGNR
ncbi:hypothetical protein [Terriglobus albidus]|uniref:hypothetical protein n=1 Tax=Terriglobus albidus TaxID=1592106 RepID=UPI0021DF525E|nr:hypothetical protein [Terriglobus albidus]